MAHSASSAPPKQVVPAASPSCPHAQAHNHGHRGARRSSDCSAREATCSSPLHPPKKQKQTPAGSWGRESQPGRRVRPSPAHNPPRRPPRRYTYPPPHHPNPTAHPHPLHHHLCPRRTTGPPAPLPRPPRPGNHLMPPPPPRPDRSSRSQMRSAPHCALPCACHQADRSDLAARRGAGFPSSRRGSDRISGNGSARRVFLFMPLRECRSAARDLGRFGCRSAPICAVVPENHGLSVSLLIVLSSIKFRSHR